MRPTLAAVLCAVALSASSYAALAQNDPAQPSPKAPPFPTTRKTPSPESPQNTTNATAQAEAEYRAALAKCDSKPQNEQQHCVDHAEEHFYTALAGTNPGE